MVVEGFYGSFVRLRGENSENLFALSGKEGRLRLCIDILNVRPTKEVIFQRQCAGTV